MGEAGNDDSARVLTCKSAMCCLDALGVTVAPPSVGCCWPGSPGFSADAVADDDDVDDDDVCGLFFSKSSLASGNKYYNRTNIHCIYVNDK